MSKTAKTATNKPYHHGDLRQALLDEGARMLEELGADGVSLRGLARRLGVSHAAPGHHFSDRDTLLAELAADGFIRLHQKIDAALDKAALDSAGLNPKQAAGEAYIDVAMSNPQTFKLMFSGLAGDDCPPRLGEESTRAYLSLLRSAGVDVSGYADYAGNGAPDDYEMGVAEFETWALIHGAATLFIDDSLNVDETKFRQLVSAMLKPDRS